MVADRRFGPLIALVVVGLFVLLVRMYQVQVVEHPLWAREATNLVRSARTIPYLRGKITDREGRVLVQDQEAYAVQFVYRDFRRGHPLGQVTHAQSALEDREIGVDEAALHLESWGMDLVLARAEDVERFGRGEAVRLCGIDYPVVDRARDRRRSRAADLRFYTQGLLGASRADWSAVKKRIKKGQAGSRSWVELVAEQEETSPEEVRERVREHLRSSLERLAQLALELGVRAEGDAPPLDAAEALWLLIEALEEERQEIEDQVAVDLFLEATGFHPGRLEPELLAGAIELGWVGRRFGWSPARTEAWTERVRADWISERRTFHAPAALIRARLRVRETGEDAFDALFGELAVLWSPRPRTPREWRERARDSSRREWFRIDELAVFVELSDLFAELELEPGERGAPLPFVDAGLRSARRKHEDPAELFAEMIPFEHAEEVLAARSPEPEFDWRGRELEPWAAPTSSTEAVRRLRALFGEVVLLKRDARDERELVPWLVELWEARFHAALRAFLEELSSQAAARQLPVPMKLTARRLKNAEQQADYSTRDRSSRPQLLDETPDDRVILYLTRYADEYRGFEVLRRTQRLAMARDADRDLVARELIGVVRESTLEEVIEQQAHRRLLAEIVHQRSRDEEDHKQVEELVASLYRNDEVHGTSGVEALCDADLRGENGFVEDEGLQEREDASRASLMKPKVDGLDVELTLSIDLQLAAQHTILRPYLPATEDSRDEFWFRNPVGAIVLATVDGEILAAASAPKEPGEPNPARDGERAFSYDRTLRRPQFQPVGSIFKPLVAAYALEYRGLDAERVYHCDVRPETGTAGWGRVACSSRWGHGGMRLVPAIQGSCNAYFAQVGELLEDQDRVREVARMFGFDRPSGVKEAGLGKGLAEDCFVRVLQEDRTFTRTQLNRAGNGLEVIEATPVQVARAVAGLATGRLPTMRLVRRVGDRPVPSGFEPIPISAAHLSLVREAMVGVVREGTARGKGLSVAELRFTLAGKTGSADYLPMTDAYRAQLRVVPRDASLQMRKHTWFVGFFPAEDPRAVVVVYCHDIGVTAGHSAVHVAAQFLKTPEVQRFVEEGPR